MKTWQYKHNFGVISVSGWGDPFVVLTENKFWGGESWGYIYWTLGLSFKTESEANEACNKLRSEYSSKINTMLNSNQSESFLLQLADKFKNADIRRQK